MFYIVKNVCYNTITKTKRGKNMYDMLKQIQDMNKKYNITNDHVRYTSEEKEYHINFMLEGVDKYSEAISKEDELKALVDLTILVLDTAERQGLLEVFSEAFDRVMQANSKRDIWDEKDKENKLSMLPYGLAPYGLTPYGLAPLGQAPKLKKTWSQPFLRDLVDDVPQQMSLLDRCCEKVKG